MNIKCDRCNEKNKGSYKTFWMEIEDKEGNIKKELTTWCYECLDGPALNGMSEKQLFEHINTPYWVHAGLPPKPKEKAQMKYMKDHNLSWGDMRNIREANMAKAATVTGLQKFQKHYEKYGRGNAPDATFGKESN